MTASRDIDAITLPGTHPHYRALETAVDHVVVQFRIPREGDPVPRQGDVVRISQRRGPEVVGTIDGTGITWSQDGAAPTHVAFRVRVSEQPFERACLVTIAATGNADHDWQLPTE